jgi:hypothetical protein
MMSGLVLQLVSGLASPMIFLSCLAIGWLVRRWWQVVIGAIAVGVLSEAEIMLVELPGATLNWTAAPLAFVAPLAWCAAGFLARGWQRRTGRLRQEGAMRSWPVVAGMMLGAFVTAAFGLGTGLLYLQTGQLEFHTLQFGRAKAADYETIFFQYVFPGLLLGQVAGGLIGRILARPRLRGSA